MPLNVELNDLIADNTDIETRHILASLTDAFMVLNGPMKDPVTRKQADDLLQNHFYDTKDLTAVRIQMGDCEHNTATIEFKIVTILIQLF